MSAPVREQAILGPLIYAPPWARRQPPVDADREDRTEPAAAEPLGMRDLGIRDKDTSFAPQPQDGFEDDFVAMSLEECLALAPDQDTDAPEPTEPMAELAPPQWCGIAWPVVTRLACTILLALAGALGFRWLSVAPEPREGQLVVQESFAQQPAAPVTMTTLKADRVSQSIPLPWSLDLTLAAGTSHDPGRQLTMSAAAAPAPAGGTTAAAVISTGPAHRATRAPGAQGNGPAPRATMVRAGTDESR
jgi:hypothetical protein